MLVNNSKLFKSSIKTIQSSPIVSLDTETTGLRPFKGDELFSVIVSTPEEVYYFDYNSSSPFFLNRKDHPVKDIIANYNGIIHMHNAKFDMGILAKEGVDVYSLKINCTMAMARLENSSHLLLSLDKLTGQKSDEVKKYISSNKLYEWETIPGKKRRVKNQFYSKVPLEVMQPYAEQDAIATIDLAKKQAISLTRQMLNHSPDLGKLVTNERRLTKTLFHMEQTGVKIDLQYTQEAYNFQESLFVEAISVFEKETGSLFTDSNLLFSKLFQERGVPFPLTAKGNPSFSDSVLQTIDHPLAKNIQTIRESYKRMGTYSDLLYFQDDGVLHPNFRQAGCVTGRMSCTNPPMQCMEKVDPSSTDKYFIRKCFVPRDGFTFYMLDYDQMEYRMMLNYAMQEDLIDKIKDGLDIHTATAEMMDVKRSHAKTINFMLIFGGGPTALAESLNISVPEAKMLKNKYYYTLPKVRIFIEKVQAVAKARGHIKNWAGRIYQIERGYEYKAPNYLIQGGCADLIKVAMNRIHTLLQNKKSNMLLQVHDELVFEIAKDEEDLVPQIKDIMENVSDIELLSHLNFTVGVDKSEKSWHEKEKLC